MRRALGLQDASPRSKGEYQPTPTIATRRPPRQFVRDGEVPVTVVHRDYRRDDTSGSNLNTIRQALRRSRQRQKSMLSDRGATQPRFATLQTQLAYERLQKKMRRWKLPGERRPKHALLSRTCEQCKMNCSTASGSPECRAGTRGSYGSPYDWLMTATC